MRPGASAASALPFSGVSAGSCQQWSMLQNLDWHQSSVLLWAIVIQALKKHQYCQDLSKTLLHKYSPGVSRPHTLCFKIFPEFGPGAKALKAPVKSWWFAVFCRPPMAGKAGNEAAWSLYFPTHRRPNIVTCCTYNLENPTAQIKVTSCIFRFISPSTNNKKFGLNAYFQGTVETNKRHIETPFLDTRPGANSFWTRFEPGLNSFEPVLVWMSMAKLKFCIFRIGLNAFKRFWMGLHEVNSFERAFLGSPQIF